MQKTLTALLTLSVGIEAEYPIEFYEKLIKTVMRGSGLTLPVELRDFAKKLLCEEDDGCNLIGDG